MVRVPPSGDDQGRGSLGEVALAVDRGGARERRGAERCSDSAWRDLVAGRLRIVERFERDGRRFVIARYGNGERSRGVLLTDREIAVVERRVRGAPLKDIAAALGVSISTVAKALTRALDKLGLENQAELIAVLGAGVGARASGPSAPNPKK